MDAIIADVERLGLKFKGPITYTSDYFPQMLDLAERLIKAGTLYADDTPVEQMRAVCTPLALVDIHLGTVPSGGAGLSVCCCCHDHKLVAWTVALSF